MTVAERAARAKAIRDSVEAPTQFGGAVRAMAKVAPLVTAQALLRSESVEPGRILYEKGCFARYIRNRREPIPVWIDHDPQRVVGHVREFSEFADVDGSWLAAHCTIDDPPGWLKRGTAASISFHPFQDQQISGWTRILDGLLSEVSILSPAVKPAEPLARVVLVQDEPTSPPVTARASNDHAAGGETWLGGEILIRPNIGQILAVY